MLIISSLSEMCLIPVQYQTNKDILQVDVISWVLKQITSKGSLYITRPFLDIVCRVILKVNDVLMAVIS